jgi:hypothetical protein
MAKSSMKNGYPKHSGYPLDTEPTPSRQAVVDFLSANFRKPNHIGITESAPRSTLVPA